MSNVNFLKNGFRSVAVLSCFVSFPAVAMLCASPPDVAIPDDSINTVPSDINPGTAATIDIVVPPSFGGTVVDLQVPLRITQAYVGDLIVTLTSPDGTVVTLIDRPGRAGGVGGHGCGQANIDVILDDSAATEADLQCSTTSPAIGGTQQPFGNLSDFIGDTIAGTWTFTATDYFPLDAGTFNASDICLDVTTTPVTVSSFKTRKRGAALIAKWETSSEIFNVGFNLWGDIGGNWTQLNNRLIASKEVNSAAPLSYRKRFNLNNLEGDIAAVGISSVSASGDEEFFGPFDIGEEYGVDAVPKYIDWSSERSKFDASMQARGYVKINNRWRKNTSRIQNRDNRLKTRFADIIIETNGSGIYKLTYDDLLAQGIDLNGMPLKHLALTRNGQAIARFIDTDSEYSRRFRRDSSIVFYAQGPTTDASRYVENAIYKIEVDPAKAVAALSSELVPGSESSESDIRSHRKTIQLAEKNIYSTAMNGDGWYDASIRAIRANASKQYSFNISNSASLDQPAIAEFSLLGIANFPRIDTDGDGDLEPNHHYKAYVNRSNHPEPVDEGYKSGRELFDVSFDASPYLIVGENTIEIEIIPDNGHNIDLVYVVDGAISYNVANSFDADDIQDGYLVVQVDQAETEIELQSNSAIADVVGVDQDLNVSRLAFSQNDGVVRIKPPFNSSSRGQLSVHVLTENAYKVPELIRQADSVNSEELSLLGVDYVIIADESLIGEDLQRFSQRHTELGRNAKVVSTKSIYNKFSGGQALPEAIAEYLQQQSLESDFAYVLLVGGHTSNYRSYNLEADKELINLLPSFYRATSQPIIEGLTEQIPTAVPFVDFNNDGAPDRAIGRWPVRNLDQLKLMVDKTLEWHADDSHRSDRTALFIADANEPKNDFVRSSNRLMSSIANESAPWTQIDTVFQDDITNNDAIPAAEKLDFARSQIIEKMNQGPALTVYSGHASVSVWGRQSLVYSDVANQFTNTGSPSIVLPLACYTTYYETPDVKSLAELMLTDNPAGAVVLSGAALLSVAGDNELFGRRLIQKMTKDGLDIGSATMQVKQELLASSPEYQTVVYNWITLGDPSLSFGLPSIPTVSNPPSEPRD